MLSQFAVGISWLQASFQEPGRESICHPALLQMVHASHLLIDIGTLYCQLYTLSCSLVQKGQVILVMITDPQTAVQTTWGQCGVAFAELTYDRR